MCGPFIFRILFDFDNLTARSLELLFLGVER